MKKIQNDDFDNKILELLADGNKQIQIAKILGVSRAEISRRIKAMRERGVEIPSTQDVFDKKVLELLAKGLTQEQIGKEIGRSDVFVSKRIKKMKEQGIKIPKTKSEIISEKILDLINDGLTQTQIAEKLNVGQTAISGRMQRMKKRGIEVQKTITAKTCEFDEPDDQEDIIIENTQESDSEIIDTEEDYSFEYSDSYTYQGKTLIYARSSILWYFGKERLSESDAKRVIDFVENEISDLLGNKKIDNSYIIDLNELCKSLREFLGKERTYKGDFSARNNLGYGILKLLDYYYEYFYVGAFSRAYLKRVITFDYRLNEQNEFEEVPLEQIDARVLRFWGCYYDDFPNEKATIQDMVTLVKKSENCNLNHARLEDIRRISYILGNYMKKRRTIAKDSRFNHVGEQKDCFQRIAQIVSDDEEEQSALIQNLTQNSQNHIKEQKECLRRIAQGASIDLPKELKNLLFECSQSRDTLLATRAFIDVLLDYEEL